MITKNLHYINQEGVAHHGDESFYFAPDNPVPDTAVKFRNRGLGQRLSDGTFEFEIRPYNQSRAVRIKKLTHGSISATKDGAILLWLKVYKDEGLDIADTIIDESLIAANALHA